MKRSAAVPYHPIGASTDELFTDCLNSPVCIFLEDHQDREPRTRNSRRLQHSVDDINNDEEPDAISTSVTTTSTAGNHLLLSDELSSDSIFISSTIINSLNSPTITDEFTNSSTETILNADESYQFSNSTSSPEDLPPPEKKFRRMQVGVGNSINAPSQAATTAASASSAATNGRSVGERLKEKQKELLANNHVHTNSNNHSMPSCSNSSVRTSRTTLPSENKQKRVPPILTDRQRNTLRVITQYLQDIGMKDTVETLVDESGCRAEAPLATRLREDVKTENWADALAIIDQFKPKLSNKDYLTLRAALVEELMKRYITKGDFLAVLICLQKEYPREREFNERKKFYAQLLADNPEEIRKHFQEQHDKADYKYLIKMMEDLLPANFLLGPSRLDDLLHQSWEAQVRNCSLHVGKGKSAHNDNNSILRDHRCSALNFPSKTIQIVKDHETEVWTLKFSPCGEYLASAGKSGIVYIWKVINEQKLSFLNRFILYDEIDGIGSLSWSSDSRYLACGTTEHRFIGVYLFDVGKIISNPSPENLEQLPIKLPSDKFSVVSFFPSNSHKFVCGDQKGNFAMFDMDQELTDKRNDFEGFRVRSLCCLKDGKTVLAADTLNRIRAYDFEKRMDHLLIQETSPIIAFTVDAKEKYCLVTTKDHGIRMWCLDTRTLVQSYFGSIHSELVVAASFGGVNDVFIASGSEKNNRIMIWKRNERHPVKYLDGHKRGVNAVAWNPKYKNMLVSGSDDHTIRVWSTPTRATTVVDNSPQAEVVSRAVKDEGEKPPKEVPKVRNGRSKPNNKKKIN